MNNSASGETTRAVEDEVTAYLANEDLQLDEDIDPIEYWKTCSIYPKLAYFALDLFMVPCSSSASETLFSHAAILSSGLKNRVGPVHLENQVLMKTNYRLLL